MADDPADIAAKINARRSEAVAPRGEVAPDERAVTDPQGVASRIERLREHRVKEPPRRALGDLLTARAKQFKRESKGTGVVAQAWSELCPAALLARTGVVGVSRGVLTLAADDSAARFEVDRVLRCGVERKLLKRLALDVRRVRVVVVDQDADNQTES